MSAGPLVSVIIPTYNRLPLLRHAIGSVRAQTHTAWELIVADDGSTDGTRDYLDALCREEPRLRVLRFPHSSGRSWLRNRAMEAARGGLVAFLDDDDLWHPAKLEAQLRALDADASAGWSYTTRDHVGPDGEPYAVKPGEWSRAVSGWILEAVLDRETNIHLSSLLVKRSLLEVVGEFDESLARAQDRDYVVRLALAAPCAGVNQALVSVRMHPGQVTRVNERPAALNALRMYERYAATHPSRAIRRIGRRQTAFYLVILAGEWIARGKRGRAALALLRSFALRPFSGTLWGFRWRRYVGRSTARG